MFGLMTVAEHERRMAQLRADGFAVEWSKSVNDRIIALESQRVEWATLAIKLTADLADLRKRELPPIPGPDEVETGSIADGDAEWTPEAIAKREKSRP